MRLNIDPEWFTQMVEKEDNKIVSVGGFFLQPSIAEIDAAIRQFEDGVIFDDNDYHYWLSAFIENYLEEPEESLPMKIYGCRKDYLSFCSAGCVATDLWEDVVFHEFNPKNTTWWHNWTTAENLMEWAAESLYSFCDDDVDRQEFNGIDDLQSALDVFRSLNQTVWLLARFLKLKAYDPHKHSIGLKSLQKALDKAEAENRHHFTYSVNYRQKVTLTMEWWLSAGWKPSEGEND